MKRNFLIGGYFLILPTYGSKNRDEVLQSDKIISVSNCICEVLPGIGFLNIGDKSDYLLNLKKKIKVGDSEMNCLGKWVIEKFNDTLFDWPSCFATASIAKEFHRSFLYNTDNVYLLAVGLTNDEAEVFIDEQRPHGPMGNIRETLMYNNFKKKLMLESSQIIGYDVLGLDTESFHSYRCHGLEIEFQDVLGIASNKFGLFDDYTAAIEAVKYLDKTNIEVEDALWQPWAIGLVEKF